MGDLLDLALGAGVLFVVAEFPVLGVAHFVLIHLGVSLG